MSQSPKNEEELDSSIELYKSNFGLHPLEGPGRSFRPQRREVREYGLTPMFNKDKYMIEGDDALKKIFDSFNKDDPDPKKNNLQMLLIKLAGNGKSADYGQIIYNILVDFMNKNKLKKETNPGSGVTLLQYAQLKLYGNMTSDEINKLSQKEISERTDKTKPLTPDEIDKILFLFVRTNELSLPAWKRWLFPPDRIKGGKRKKKARKKTRRNRRKTPLQNRRRKTQRQNRRRKTRQNRRRKTHKHK